MTKVNLFVNKLPHEDRYIWELWEFPRRQMIDPIHSHNSYTSQASAERSARKWAKKHNFNVVCAVCDTF